MFQSAGKFASALALYSIMSIAPANAETGSSPVAEFKLDLSQPTTETYRDIVIQAKDVCKGATRHLRGLSITHYNEIRNSCISELVDKAVQAIGEQSIVALHNGTPLLIAEKE